MVQQFYNQRRRQLLAPEILPNAAHVALATLESQFPGDFLLVTQNIDNLHQRAGSKQVIHMHGELLKARCLACHQSQTITQDLHLESTCDFCSQVGRLRPDIVWFGEVPMQMDEIVARLEGCDLFVSIGTSGNVYPAAGFVELANRVGAHTWELNLEPSLRQTAFKHHRYGTATRVVPEFVSEFLASRPQ